MRLTFPHGEHPGLRLQEGEVTIGSAADNRIAIAGAGLAPQHARIVADRRGLWLHVRPGAAAVHLNARPVRELAMLRLGDVLHLEHVQMLVCADEDEIHQRGLPANFPPASGAPGNGAPRVVLRGVAGSHFGRSYPVDRPLLIGRGESADIRLDNPAVAERHAQVELEGGRIALRRIGGQGVRVNGVEVSDCLLAPGDQIVIEPDRFVVEAPGFDRPRTPANDLMFVPGSAYLGSDASADPESDAADACRSVAVWWLVAAAAVLAAAITALLVYGPRLPG